jgi:hypothetical protein
MPIVAQQKDLVNEVFRLLERHAGCFRQERVFGRVVALVFGEIMAIAHHTISQLIWGLGQEGKDWSAWYRLFSRGRFRGEAAGKVMVAETLTHVEADQVYVVGLDGFQVPRSGKKIEGSGWGKSPRSPAWRVGLHWAQRFFHLSWLTPEAGSCRRAIPLLVRPAFTHKARRTATPACSEWEAAAESLRWLRAGLTAAGRGCQPILALADGAFDVVALWCQLEAGVTLLVRTAKNRALFALPGPQHHKNRKYGEQAPAPADWLQVKGGWRTETIIVRSTPRRLCYRIEGPFLRKGAPGIPLFLLVIKGQSWAAGPKRRRRQPTFLLVNARWDAITSTWTLPFPPISLLIDAWHRWELEVAHREMKTTFGLGDKQCWHPRAAVVSVQWSAWLYGLLLLAGYRTWGLTPGPRLPTAWWLGGRRWSFNTLWRVLRLSLVKHPDFRPYRAATPYDGFGPDTFLDLLWRFAQISLPT